MPCDATAIIVVAHATVRAASNAAMAIVQSFWRRMEFSGSRRGRDMTRQTVLKSITIIFSLKNNQSITITANIRKL